VNFAGKVSEHLTGFYLYVKLTNCGFGIALLFKLNDTCSAGATVRLILDFGAFNLANRRE